jgi:hypothetical protein
MLWHMHWRLDEYNVIAARQWIAAVAEAVSC